MTQTQFQELLQRRMQLTESVLDSKSKEYSTDADKLHNFKRTAAMRGSIPTESLQGFMDKHLSSYFDMLDGIKAGKTYTRDYVDEKLGDIINYFILQEALIVENHLTK